MKTKHKWASIFIVATITWINYCLKLKIEPITGVSLITFFSVVFGFYVTSLSILYSSSYIEELHKKIDEKAQKRETHILKDYLLAFGFCSMSSVVLIVVFVMLGVRNHVSEKLTIFFGSFLDWKILVDSLLLGISTLNIFYMLIMLRFIAFSMVSEARYRARKKTRKDS